jgi:hypothetical protein
MNGNGNHHINNPDRERQISHVLSYMMNLDQKLFFIKDSYKCKIGDCLEVGAMRREG